jgi:tetratricopeptide (TPR) repeat protein
VATETLEVARLTEAGLALAQSGRDLFRGGDHPAAARAFIHAGDTMVAAGDRPDVLHAYREALAIYEKLAADDSANVAWQSDIADCHDRIGYVLLRAGDGNGALAAHRKSLRVRSRLAARDRRNAGWQRAVAISHREIGRALLFADDSTGEPPHEEARDALQKSWRIIEALAKDNPDNAELQRDLARISVNSGDLLIEWDRDVVRRRWNTQVDRVHDLAAKAYYFSLSVTQKLVARDPDNAVLQQDLSLDHERIGNALLRRGDRKGALDAYRLSEGIAKELVARDPDNAEWQHLLAVYHARIGNALLGMDDRKGALDAYRKSLEISRKLTENDPKNARWRHNLSVVYHSITEIEQVLAESTTPGYTVDTMRDAAADVAEARTLSDTQLKENIQRGDAAAVELETRVNKARAPTETRPIQLDDVGRPSSMEEAEEYIAKAASALPEEARAACVERMRLEFERAAALTKRGATSAAIRAALADQTYWDLQERFETGVHKVELPTGGLTREQATAARAFYTTFQRLQEREETLGLPKTPQTDKVRRAGTMSSTYYKHKPPAGEVVPARPPGRPRKSASNNSTASAT